MGGSPRRDDGESSASVQHFQFCDLRQVSLAADDGATPVVELVDLHGFIHSLPLDHDEHSVMGKGVQEGLEAGFKSALTHAESAANWGMLREALREEYFRVHEGAIPDDMKHASSEAGQITLEVFEIERWMLMANEWQTPCLPTDNHLSWRWVDATGHKHPHLQRLPRSQIAARRSPPCELDTMFQTAGEWAIDKHVGADDEGWTYGSSWRSATWEANPGLFDVLRRRKWLRTYR